MSSQVGSRSAQKPSVVFLMGPTASGKTDLAMALAEHMAIDVISVDSALIYRHMDIGTAKPSDAELQQVPHALVNICDPAEAYSVADFCRDAQCEIERSIGVGRTPVLVGGTMMYFNALLNGLADMPATDEPTRVQIEAEAEQQGWPAMHQQLTMIDPVYAASIHPNHSQRIGRALAVYRMSGKTMSHYRHQQTEDSWLTNHHRVHQFALVPQDRTYLHQRIEKRFHAMLAAGFIDEVERLYRRGDLHLDMPSMRAVGYRQAWQYLSGECGYEQMADKAIVATRQLAKRQLTWLRGWQSLHLLEIDAINTTLAANFDKNLHKVLNFLSIRII